jgi:Pyridoxamine 5'-phosphate oxidase
VTAQTIDATALTDGKETAWRTAKKRLETPEPEQTYWLATVQPDGRPHVMPLIGIWVDDAFYFLSGEETRKGRNLEADPRCVIAGSSRKLPSIDIIIEGDARRVSDAKTLRRVVDVFTKTLHWPQLEIRDGAVDGPNAPTAGPPPYAVFEVVPMTAFGLPGVAGMDETPQRATPTRWRFQKAR